MPSLVTEQTYSDALVQMPATETSSTHGIWHVVASGPLWARAKARAQTLDE